MRKDEKETNDETTFFRQHDGVERVGRGEFLTSLFMSNVNQSGGRRVGDL